MAEQNRKFNCAFCKELACTITYNLNKNSKKHELIIEEPSGVQTYFVDISSMAESYKVITESIPPRMINEYLIEKTKKKEAFCPRGLFLYCKDCDKIYCTKHYVTAYRESETQYRCPNGHEKIIRD